MWNYCKLSTHYTWHIPLLLLNTPVIVSDTYTCVMIGHAAGALPCRAAFGARRQWHTLNTLCFAAYVVRLSNSSARKHWDTTIYTMCAQTYTGYIRRLRAPTHQSMCQLRDVF